MRTRRNSATESISARLDSVTSRTGTVRERMISARSPHASPPARPPTCLPALFHFVSLFLFCDLFYALGHTSAFYVSFVIWLWFLLLCWRLCVYGMFGLVIVWLCVCLCFLYLLFDTEGLLCYSYTCVGFVVFDLIADDIGRILCIGLLNGFCVW